MNKICECGCGKEVTNEKNRFISGHNRSHLGKKHSDETKARISAARIGCTSWNKGKHFSDEEKERMSKAQQTEECRNKRIHACRKNLGVDYAFQSDAVKEKIRQKNIENLGVPYSMQSKEILQKAQQTNKIKYGGLSSMCSEEVQIKARKTCKENFGYENPMWSKIIKEKFRKTCEEKYGGPSSLCSKEVRTKAKKTCEEKYGEDNWAKTPQGRECSRKTAVRYIEDQKLNGEPLCPRIGIPERNCLNIFEQLIPYKIIRNDHSIFDLVAFFPDGHIPELKLFIEFDEKEHFEDKEEMTILKQKDIYRQVVLESISGYRVFRVSEKDWIKDKQKVINEFNTLIGNKI